MRTKRKAAMLVEQRLARERIEAFYDARALVIELARGVPVTRFDPMTAGVVLQPGETVYRQLSLHLATRYQEHDRVRHLIVELKAPGVTIGRQELNQVEDYGNAILSGPQFSSSTAQWDLILIGTSLDDVAQNRIQPENFELGKFWGPTPKPGHPRVTAYVRRWRDVIDENKRRLDFVTSALEHDPSISEGLDYVREQYADLLPRSVQTHQETVG